MNTCTACGGSHKFSTPCTGGRMKPHEETWRVVGCGDSTHGPERQCWKVKDASGKTVLRSVNKATAARYAAFPAMARALLAVRDWDTSSREHPDVAFASPLPLVVTTLKDAGVLE